MEKFLIILVVLIVVGLVVYLFLDWKKDRDQIQERNELIEACKNADIDKMIELLEKGLDPNMEIRHPILSGGYIIETLLDVTRERAAVKLLRSYGAKTGYEIEAEEKAIEKAHNEAREAEMRHQEAIRQAEEKAKKEADMQKVEAFLASKGKA